MAVRMITAKWDKSNLKRKLARWQAMADREMVDGVKAYGGEAAQMMTRATPPGNGRMSVSEALRNLKRRIEEDLQGSGAEFFDGARMVWFHRGGKLVSVLVDAHGRSVRGGLSPFRVVRGRMNKDVQEWLKVGRWGVRLIDGDVGSFIRGSSQYEMRATTGGRVVRLQWHGPRHVVKAGALRREVARRKRRAGTLMAGWKALAARAGVRLPAAVMRQTGRGSARLRRDGRHGAVLSGTNSGNYRGLQVIVDRQLPGLRRRNVRLARRRVRQLAQAMGSVR